MKKFLSMILVFALALTVTGCAVSLSDATANDGKIKSCGYDLAVSFSDPSADDSSTQSLEMSGDMSITSSRLINGGNLNISMTNMKGKVPFYLNTARKGLDFNFYVGIPDALKTELSYILNGKTMFYLNSKDLESYLKNILTSDEYKQFEDAVNNPNTVDPKPVLNDMKAAFKSYVTKNKLEKFTKTGSLLSRDGQYDYSFNQKTLKGLIDSYLGNKTYFSHLHAYFEKVQKMSPDSDYKDLLNMTAKDMQTEVANSLDEADGLKLALTCTVKDSFLAGMKMVLSDTKEKGTLLSLDLKLTNINKAVKITEPSKDSGSVYDVGNMLSTLGGLSAYGSDDSDSTLSAGSSSTTSSLSSSASSSSVKPLAGHVSMSAKDIDKISATIGSTTLKIGGPVSDLIKAGYTVGSDYTNTTVDSSHYTSIGLKKGNTYLDIKITSTKNAATPVNQCVVAGFGIDSYDQKGGVLSDGIALGMSLDDYKAKVQLPTDASQIYTSGNDTTYTYYGTDSDNTSLELNFQDGTLYAADFSAPGLVSK